MNATDDKVAYMRDYRARYRSTPEGREKLREASKRWKKSEAGKKAAQRRHKKKYVPSDRVLKTPEEKAETKRVRERLYYARTRERRQEMWNARMSHLKRYGLTREQYEAMLAAQHGGCAVCGGTNGSSRNRKLLCVDHCHHTGKVRGLLCDNCNRGIGALKDDLGLVRKALLYLEAHHG